MADDDIKLTPEQWQKLHTRKFQDELYDRAWKRIAWIFGSGSLIALVGAAVALWGPIKSQIVTEATDKVRTELAGRITGEIAAQLRREAQEIAKTEATSEVRSNLRTPGSPMRTELDATLRAILRDGGLVREILVAEARRDFLTGSVDQRAAHFRLLHSLDPAASRDALKAALQERLTLGAARHANDEALIVALGTLTPHRGARAQDAPAAQISQNLDLATLVLSVIELTRVPDNTASEAFVEAAGRWLGSLGPARQVTEWLEMRAVRSRAAPGRNSVVWEVLLRDERPEALEALGGLFSRAPAAEIESALRLLSRTNWPQLDAAPAEQLLRVIEPHVPDAVLGHAGLSPALLEARWAIIQATARSPQAVRFAWTLHGATLRAAAVPEWRPLVENYTRALARSPPPVVEAAANALVGLTASGFNDANRYWPGVLARVLAAVPEEQADAFVRLLLPEAPAAAHPDVLARYDRRLAVLALGFIREGMSVEMRPAIPAAILAALAASPRLESSIPLGVALQRVVSFADPAICAAALGRLATKLSWPAATLLACAGRSPSMGLELLAERLNATEPRERLALLRLWALGSNRLSDFAWPPANDEAATAAITVAALRGHGAPVLSAPMLRVLQAIRPVSPAEVDLALARDSGLHLYPAPAGTPEGALPPWSAPAWWEGAVVVAGDDQTLTAPKERPWKLRVACDASRRTRVSLDDAGTNANLLIVMEGREARYIAGELAGRIPIADAGCVGDALLRLNVPENARLRVWRSAPAEASRGAPTFDARASVPPLEPGRAVNIQLGQQEEAYFPTTLAPGRRYAVFTRDLDPGTDTAIALLGADGVPVAREAENDDGGEESLASRIETEELPVSAVVAIRAATFDGKGGRFELVVQDLGPIEAAILQEPLALDSNAERVVLIMLQAGRRYVVSTRNLAARVDTTVAVLGPGGVALGEDDDSGGSLASRLVFDAPADGEYRITIRNIGQGGRFNLVVRPER